MRSVTMLGFGNSVRELMYLGTLEKELRGEVWLLNGAWNVFGMDFCVKHAKRWFALHELKLMTKTYKYKHDDVLKTLAEMNIPVYMQGRHLKVPKSIPYPIDDIMKRYKTRFFAGSPSYMLALACHEGVDELCTYGIDLMDDQHINQQKAWCYWLRIAEQQGMRFSGTAAALLYEADADVGLTNYPIRCMSHLFTDTAVVKKAVMGGDGSEFVKCVICKQETPYKDTALKGDADVDGDIYNLCQDCLCKFIQKQLQGHKEEKDGIIQQDNTGRQPDPSA
jgi:hypothetical protein